MTVQLARVHLVLPGWDDIKGFHFSGSSKTRSPPPQPSLYIFAPLPGHFTWFVTDFCISLFTITRFPKPRNKYVDYGRPLHRGLSLLNRHMAFWKALTSTSTYRLWVGPCAADQRAALRHLGRGGWGTPRADGGWEQPREGQGESQGHERPRLPAELGVFGLTLQASS